MQLKRNSKKMNKIELLIYLSLAIISGYFAMYIRMKDFYIDVILWDLYFIILIIISLIFTIIIYKGYKLIFRKILKNYSIKEEIIQSPLLIIGSLFCIVIIIFTILLNYFVLKIDNTSVLGNQWDIAMRSAERFLLPFMLFIQYLILFSAFSVIVYQLYKLYKQKVPFFRSLIAVIVSMAVLLLLLDWLVYILDILSGMF